MLGCVYGSYLYGVLIYAGLLESVGDLGVWQSLTAISLQPNSATSNFALQVTYLNVFMLCFDMLLNLILTHV
jgi:hypothetical protein